MMSTIMMQQKVTVNHVAVGQADDKQPPDGLSKAGKAAPCAQHSVMNLQQHSQLGLSMNHAAFNTPKNFPRSPSPLGTPGQHRSIRDLGKNLHHQLVLDEEPILDGQMKHDTQHLDLPLLSESGPVSCPQSVSASQALLQVHTHSAQANVSVSCSD